MQTKPVKLYLFANLHDFLVATDFYQLLDSEIAIQILCKFEEVKTHNWHKFFGVDFEDSFDRLDARLVAADRAQHGFDFLDQRRYVRQIS